MKTPPLQAAASVVNEESERSQLESYRRAWYESREQLEKLRRLSEGLQDKLRREREANKDKDEARDRERDSLNRAMEAGQTALHQLREVRVDGWMSG